MGKKATRNYLDEKLEKRLKRALKLEIKIEHPEPECLLSEQRRLEEEYENLMDDKTRLYLAAKKVLAFGFKLVCRPDNNEIGYVQNYSQAGYPEVSYADEDHFTLPIASGGKFIELTAEEFMRKITTGDFKPIDRICLKCEKLVPYGKKICENCGNKI